MQTFEAWFDGADYSVALMSLSEVARLKAHGGWLQEPVFLHRIRAASLEEAVDVHREKMDWDNFADQTDLIETCSGCGVGFFPKRSASCPNCSDEP
ncbi:hypothetical protein [Microvirga lenta]|uniref:hypothetical protein n=1 Tax=Microvirga lenta TaxID=2881337 RepID=UPI001CFEA8E4|nr:hypothetical protein [Microvirga lenta]MCB5173709.1 hypothetical protein [Microvirga lenta]